MEYTQRLIFFLFLAIVIAIILYFLGFEWWIFLILALLLLLILFWMRPKLGTQKVENFRCSVHYYHDDEEEELDQKKTPGKINFVRRRII